MKFPVIVHLLSAVVSVIVAALIVAITNPHSLFALAVIFLGSAFFVPMIPILIFTWKA